MKREKLKIYSKIKNLKNGIKVYKKDLPNMFKKHTMKRENRPKKN